MDYFSNFSKHELIALPDDVVNCNTETCRSCFNVNFNVNFDILRQLNSASVGE